MSSIPRFNDDVTAGSDRGNGGVVPSLLTFVDVAGRDIRAALDRSAPGRRLVDHRRYLQRQLRCRYSHRRPVEAPHRDAPRHTPARSTSGGGEASTFGCSQTGAQCDTPKEVTSAMTKTVLDQRVSSAQPDAVASCGSRSAARADDPCCRWPTEGAPRDADRSARGGGGSHQPRGNEHPEHVPRHNTQLSPTRHNTQLSPTIATPDRCAASIGATNDVRSNRNAHAFNIAEITSGLLMSENIASTTDPTLQPGGTGGRNYSPASDGQSDSAYCVSRICRGTTGGSPVTCRAKSCREGNGDDHSSCSGQTCHWVTDAAQSIPNSKTRGLSTEHSYPHAGVSFPFVCGISTTETTLREIEPARGRLSIATSITREQWGKRKDSKAAPEVTKDRPDDRDVGCGCRYTDNRKPETVNNNNNNRHGERDSMEQPSQIPLRQRHLPASFWKEPNVPKLPPPLPPEYIAAAFYGTRKYDELSAHALAPSQIDMLAYRHMSAYACNGVGLSGYSPCLPDNQRPCSLTTGEFYTALAASRYQPELYASLYAAAAVDAGGERATWTQLPDRKSPAVGETQRRCYLSPASLNGRVSGRTPSESWHCVTVDYNGTLYDKINSSVKESFANGESVQHQHVWKPIPTKSMTTSFGSRFHPFAGVR